MFFRVLNRCIDVLNILCMAVMTVFVGAEVILRYCFSETLYVTEELARYLLVWMVFLSSSLAIRDDSHISIGSFVNRFHGRFQAWWKLVAQSLLLTFFVYMVIEGSIVASMQWIQTVPSLGVSIFWFYLAVPVGGFLMLLNLLPRMWQNLKIISGGVKAEEDECELPGDGGVA